jgi:flagellar hook-basal body protein
MTAFGIGVSALQASNRNLETIGNNVANASTVGFKQSRVEFADIYSKAGLTTGSDRPGQGVYVAGIAQQFTQGGTSFTQNSLDMKIDGNGFFVVQEGGQNIYTRAGMFGMDKDGYVVTNEGNRLQGFPATTNGDAIEVGAVEDLYIPVANIEPNATSEVDVAFNLDSREVPPSNYVFDENDSDTYTHLYPSVIYDSLGNAHTMTQYFVKQPPYTPDLGEPARALEAMIGFSRYGSDHLTTFDPVVSEGNFVGDSDEADATNLDADIAAILDGNFTLPTATENFIEDEASGGVDDITRGQQLDRVHTALSNLIETSSGRTKEFYQAAYDGLVEYLPNVTSAAGEVDVDVYKGALAAMENAALSGQNVAYANIDVLSGVMRSNLLTSDLTSGLDAEDVDTTVTVEDAQALVSDLRSALGALLSGDTDWAPTGTLWNEGDFKINASPTVEEQATYKLALDALAELSVDLDDGAGALDPSSVIATLDALESESADNRWQMHAFVDGERVTDGNENSPDYFSFNFTEFGQMAEPLPTITIRDWTPRDDAQNQNGSLEPQEFTVDLAGTTQFAGAFGATSLSQDGFATGELAGLDVDSEGVISARYTNGTNRLIGQVAIATFRNDQGLEPIGGTSWAQTTESGDPVVNAPGVSVAGNIRSQALEDSNVDLSQELVKMILAQRDYQANAKTIQTADTLTQTIINLR